MIFGSDAFYWKKLEAMRTYYVIYCTFHLGYGSWKQLVRIETIARYSALGIEPTRCSALGQALKIKLGYSSC